MRQAPAAGSLKATGSLCGPLPEALDPPLPSLCRGGNTLPLGDGSFAVRQGRIPDAVPCRLTAEREPDEGPSGVLAAL